MKLAIIFGAQSYEHEISIVSAITLKNLLSSDFELDFIFVSPNREFFWIDKSNMNASFFAQKAYTKTPLTLTKSGFVGGGIFGKKQINSTFLNLVHGADGEDFRLSALLEWFNLSFISPRSKACFVSFDKSQTKIFAKNIGVNVLDYEVISVDDTPKLDFPIILKPLRLGSSIGLSLAKDKTELDYAKDKCFEFDKLALVEPFVAGVKEYNLAGVKIKDEFVFSRFEEPQKDEILDFDKKYLDFSRSKAPKEPELSKELKQKMQEYFSKIYQEGEFDGCIIRCDFFVINGDVFLNEINPVPGSLANYLFDDFKQVLKNLINNLPTTKTIDVNYKFLTSITKAKG